MIKRELMIVLMIRLIGITGVYFLSRVVELAKHLAEAISQSEEAQALDKALTRVNEHEAAKVMLDDYRKRQEALQKEIAAGKDVKEAMEDFQKLSQVVMVNPYLRDYVMAEMSLGAMVSEVYNVIGEAFRKITGSVADQTGDVEGVKDGASGAAGEKDAN